MVIPISPTLPKNASHPEEDVKGQLRSFLPRYFIVREEIAGIGPEGERVRIDFWCYPKPSMLELGWPARYFGVETKSHGLQDQRKKAASLLVYQASRYSLSRFRTESGAAFPDLVLIYPPIANILSGCDDGDRFLAGYALGLQKEMGWWRVGELIIQGVDFEVRLHGKNRWFHSRWGKSKMDCLGERTTRASR